MYMRLNILSIGSDSECRSQNSGADTQNGTAGKCRHFTLRNNNFHRLSVYGDSALDTHSPFNRPLLLLFCFTGSAQVSSSSIRKSFFHLNSKVCGGGSTAPGSDWSRAPTLPRKLPWRRLRVDSDFVGLSLRPAPTSNPSVWRCRAPRQGLDGRGLGSVPPRSSSPIRTTAFVRWNAAGHRNDPLPPAHREGPVRHEIHERNGRPFPACSRRR